MHRLEESAAINEILLNTPGLSPMMLAEYLLLSALAMGKESAPKRHFTLATPLLSTQEILMVSALELTLALSRVGERSAMTGGRESTGVTIWA